MLFSNTRLAVNKTVSDIKFSVRFANLCAQIFYIGYLIYALSANIGMPVANIVLLAISVAYFVFYVSTLGVLTKAEKRLKSNAGHAYRWIKISLGAITLATTIYGIYVAASDVNPITIILATLAVIAWILQVALEFVVFFFEHHMYMIMDAVAADKEAITQPVRAVGDFVKKVATETESAASGVRSFIGSALGKMRGNGNE